jgi:hypothetical protein
MNQNAERGTETRPGIHPENHRRTRGLRNIDGCAEPDADDIAAPIRAPMIRDRRTCTTTVCIVAGQSR